MLNQNLALSLEWGLSRVVLKREGFDDQSKLSFCNPLIGVRLNKIGLPFQINVSPGFRIGIPLAVLPGNIPENRLTELNYNNAVNSRGWENAFLFQMNSVPFILDFKSEKILRNGAVLSFEMNPAYLSSVNSRQSEFTLLLSLEAVYPLAGFEAGLIIRHFISSGNLENNDHNQSSAGIKFSFSSPLGKTSLKTILNIDKPNGISADEPKPFWGVVAGIEF